MARISGVSTGATPANTNVLIATTLPKLQKQVVDAFFTATPFFWWIREKSRVKTWDGGDTLEVPIMYDQAPGARAYQSYEVMDVKPPQGLTVSVWALSHYRIPMMYSRQTVDANAGDSRIVNLVDTLKEQVQLSLTKAINDDLFATSQDVLKINSMYHLFEENAAASQTQICGGISKSTYSWWRHNYAAVTSASAGILAAIRELHMACANGVDKPDLALCDDYTYIDIEDKLQTAVRFVNPAAVDWGFENIAYKGVTIMFDKSIADDGHNGDGDGSFFLLNTKYLNLYVGHGANFKFIAPEYDKFQDSYVGVLLVDLQLVCTQMARQGAMTGGAYKLAC